MTASCVMNEVSTTKGSKYETEGSYVNVTKEILK